MWSSQARGVEGHQWRLHRTSGTHLPCRIVRQCGWASAAGTNTATLLDRLCETADYVRKVFAQHAAYAADTTLELPAGDQLAQVIA
jgi:hypothetical protein